MNHKHFIIAAPALVAAAMVLTSAEANAKVPPDDSGPAAVVPHDPPPNPSYDPADNVSRPATSDNAGSSDDTAVEGLQAGAAALGGAGLAFAGMWLYRRRQTHVA